MKIRKILMSSAARLPAPLLLALVFSAGPARGGTVLVPVGSEPWAPMEILRPKCEQVDAEWRIEGDGRIEHHGGWDFHFKDFKPGVWYRVEARCGTRGVASINENVRGEIIWYKAKSANPSWGRDGARSDWAYLRFAENPDGTCQFSYDGPAPADAVAATVRLTLRWTSHGQVSWSRPTLAEMPAPAPRKVKMALATGKFPGGTVAANIEFAGTLIDRAAAEGAEVVCLPELISVLNVDGPHIVNARPVPGTETDILCERARKARTDVVCSFSELDQGMVFNTALYIDRERGIIGKYRKVLPSVKERWDGISSGREFPVFQTRYGKAGMLICLDNVQLEHQRILALKGAEIIYMPIMGDPRMVMRKKDAPSGISNGGISADLWRRIMQVRAMDNATWMVISRNVGELGMFVRPDGEIVAEFKGSEGVLTTEVDLNYQYLSYIGSDYSNRYWGERRPGAFGALTSTGDTLAEGKREERQGETIWNLTSDLDFKDESWRNDWKLEGEADLALKSEKGEKFLEIRTRPGQREHSAGQSVLWYKRRLSGDVRFVFRAKGETGNKSILYFNARPTKKSGLKTVFDWERPDARMSGYAADERIEMYTLGFLRDADTEMEHRANLRYIGGSTASAYRRGSLMAGGGYDQATVLASFPSPSKGKPDTWFLHDLQIVGNKMTLWVDGAKVFEAEDTGKTGGAEASWQPLVDGGFLAFRNFQPGVVCLDYLKVYRKD